MCPLKPPLIWCYITGGPRGRSVPPFYIYLGVEDQKKMAKTTNKKKNSRSRSRSRSRYLRKSQAKAALTRAYRKKMEGGGFKSSKGMRQSMAYDMNHKGERGPVVRDRRYLEDPIYYDYPGVDDGSMSTEEAIKIVKNAVRKYGPEVLDVAMEAAASAEASVGESVDDNDAYPGDQQAILDFIQAYANRKKETGEPYYKNHSSRAGAMRKDMRTKAEKQYSTKKMSRKSYDDWKASPWDSDLNSTGTKNWGDLPTRGKKAQAGREAFIDAYLDEHRPVKKGVYKSIPATTETFRMPKETFSGPKFPKFQAEQAKLSEFESLTIAQIKAKLLDFGVQPIGNDRAKLLAQLRDASQRFECPSFSISDESIDSYSQDECKGAKRAKNLRTLHPDKNPRCSLDSTRKFQKYQSRCASNQEEPMLFL
jgi:hypothetical protein